MPELGNPGDFVTLDTKILAQLSKVAKGELARQILTFKDRGEGKYFSCLNNTSKPMKKPEHYTGLKTCYK